MKYTIIRAFDKDGNSRILYSAGPSSPEEITVYNIPASQDEEIKVQICYPPTLRYNAAGYIEVDPITTGTTNK